MHPDLTIESARLIGEGMANDVVIINDAWFFRFAKTEWSRLALAIKVRVLDHIAGHMPLPVPGPLPREADAIVYRLIEGEPLTHWALDEMVDGVQQAVVDHLGAFLRASHTMSAPDGIRVVTPEQRRARYVECRIFIENALTSHLMQHQIAFMRRLFDDALGPRRSSTTHLRSSTVTSHRSHLVGLGDVTPDWRHRLRHGAPWVSSLRLRLSVTKLRRTIRRAAVWHRPRSTQLYAPRRFYAHVSEFDWAALGVEYNSPWFYTAHLGNARDVELVSTDLK